MENSILANKNTLRVISLTDVTPLPYCQLSNIYKIRSIPRKINQSYYFIATLCTFSEISSQALKKNLDSIWQKRSQQIHAYSKCGLYSPLFSYLFDTPNKRQRHKSRFWMFQVKSLNISIENRSKGIILKIKIWA